MRVRATPEAEAAVRRVSASGREDLVMVLGNGCCDSTAPYLFDRYVVDRGAREVGRVAEVPVYAPEWLTRLYPADELVVDAEAGVRSDSFSLETTFGWRFVLAAPERTTGG
jgi:uncharacterized protein (DUF779 family)